MAVSANDIIRITARQSYLSETVLNVFFFEVNSLVGAPTYEDMATDFVASWISGVSPIQSNQLVLNLIRVENLTDGIEFGEFPFNQAGSVSGSDALPSYVAHGVQLIRTTKLTRHGGKRYAGVTENQATGNTSSLSAGEIAALEAFNAGPVLVSDGSGNTCSLSAVIVGRSLDGSGNYVIDLAKINPVAAADYRGITSQVTRKAGRGI